MDEKTRQALVGIPKQYAEMIMFGNDSDIFVMTVLCGTNASNFAINPRHAKRMLKALGDNIGKYEKRYGKIDGEWNVPSPFEMSDLSSPKKNPDGSDQPKK